MVTRVPARDTALSLLKRCRSSDLCLEWEARLARDEVFRGAPAPLSFFTNGAVKLEGTTIARHGVAVGAQVSQDWLFKSPEAIREFLDQRAARHTETGEPLICASTDAHALRRYVDDTWNAEWKIVHGPRAWCVDAKTDKIIHLGGQFTWGPGVEVEKPFIQLRDAGYLPVNGDNGEGMKAQLVFITDGASWTESRLKPLFVGAALILGALRVLERLATYSAVRFREGSKRARSLYNKAARLLFGPKSGTVKTGRTRKNKGTPEALDPPKESVVADDLEDIAPLDGAGKVMESIQELGPSKGEAAREAHDTSISFLAYNLHRLDSLLARAFGLQIGSGAMEFMHRIGRQVRLNRPGARWPQDTSIAILNLKMMPPAGRWDEL